MKDWRAAHEAQIEAGPRDTPILRLTVLIDAETGLVKPFTTSRLTSEAEAALLLQDLAALMLRKNPPTPIQSAEWELRKAAGRAGHGGVSEG